MFPKITLIMPSLNQAKFIRQAIRSVLRQGYPRLEFLVLDGGSTDGTIDILHSFGKSIRWVSQTDDGQVDALNRGLGMTDGEIIGYLNSDDFLVPGALWKVALFFQSNPQRLWLTGNYGIVDSSSRPISPGIRAFKFVQRWLASIFPILWPFILGVNNPIAQPSTFWRRSAHKTLGYFNQEYYFVFDYDFWLRLLKLQPPAVTNDRLSFFRVHASSKGGGGYQRQFAEQLQCARNHRLPEYALGVQGWLNECVCWIYSRQRQNEEV